MADINKVSSSRTEHHQFKSPEKGSDTDEKTKKIFSQKKSVSGDSDDELEEEVGKLTIFKKKTVIPVEAMTIPCLGKSGEIKNIKGSTLIEIVHDKIQDEYAQVVDLACEYEKDIDGTLISPPYEKNGIIAICEPKDWVMSLGGWKSMMPSEEVPSYFFYQFSSKKQKFVGVRIIGKLVFPIIDNRLHITKGFSIGTFAVTQAWAKTHEGFKKISDKTDLSYPQIIRAIEHIKKTFSLKDSMLATIQLHELGGSELPDQIWQNTPEENREQILQFLNYLNGLMFGIEASGLNAALIISLMTLDLIANEKLDYTKAFKANEDGGVYPYACFGDNKGTYNERETILLHAKEHRSSLSMKKFRETPSLSPVANKEAILIKEWLTTNGVISKDLFYENQIERIKLAIDDLFCHYFAPWVHKEKWVVKRFLKK